MTSKWRHQEIGNSTYRSGSEQSTNFGRCRRVLKIMACPKVCEDTEWSEARMEILVQ